MDRHEPFVRATVVKVRGSVPGKLGASMILRKDGSILGTVGGAALEEDVRRRGMEALATGTGDLVHYDLQAWRAGGLPSLCGGSVDIALEFVGSRPNLLLWGGGHVAHAIASQLGPLGYDFSVADDRAAWVTSERFPGADRREVVQPDELWAVFDPSEFTHLYVLGYDAEKDLRVLRGSIDRFTGFLGLIASESKRLHLFDRLRRDGASPSELDRVHSPIGLPIGAESPAEIAVSVVAEIIRSQHPPRRAEEVRVRSAPARRSRRAIAPAAAKDS